MVKTLKRKHVRAFWTLIWTGAGLEWAAMILELIGERRLRSWMTDLAPGLALLGLALLLAAVAVLRRCLLCPNCRSRRRSASVRLGNRKTDCCRSCGTPILFDDEV